MKKFVFLLSILILSGCSFFRPGMYYSSQPHYNVHHLNCNTHNHNHGYVHCSNNWSTQTVFIQNNKPNKPNRPNRPNKPNNKPIKKHRK